MVAHKKALTSPPWWVRAPLYAALPPGRDLKDVRLRMQRDFIRLARRGNKRATIQFCFHHSSWWALKTAERWILVLVALTSRLT